MDPVDVLSFAVTAAQYIRSAADPEAVLADGFRMAGVPAPDPDEPFAVRVARLVGAVADDRRDLLDHLRAKAGPLPLNRPMPTGDEEMDEADPEAVRLLEYGSYRDIAGITNAAGNVVGLMPHPEHAVETLCGPTSDGLGFFASVLGRLAAAR